MRANSLTWGLALAAFSVAVATAPDASACGGFFCDNPAPGTPPMPVDQTGETIVFVMGADTVEAHIQIQYTGDPERFAWLIPLQAVPEVSVGSARLFANLLNGTVPTVTLNTSFDFCSDGSSRSSSGCSFGMGASSDEASAPAGRGAGGSGGAGNVPPVLDVNVDVVGAFEVAILSGSSASIEAWLVENGYLPDDEAPQIVDDYASRGYVFAAIKLRAGAGLDELHPLVIEYQGSEPCIPLKLTRIAASEDMAVRAFFLGDRRVVPTSYRHVTLNFARFDWMNAGSNYTDLVSRAVDSAGAAGRAFVTEYAGTNTAVSNEGLWDSRWRSATFSAIQAVDVVDELERQGLMQCSSGSTCEAFHPQVLPLLRNHLSPPTGVSEADFWACVSCYADRFDLTAFSGAAFAADFEALIVEPGLHARQVLGGSSYVTRLFTTISPEEMTEDPEFAEVPSSMGDVSPALAATDRTTCDSKQVMNLPDGREVAHPAGAWVSFGDAMPWAERVEEFSKDGTSVVLADFGDEIEAELDAWNRSQGWDPGSADRERLSETQGGGTCACGVSGPPSQGLAYLLFGALALVRRMGSGRRRAQSNGA
jgi:hypothetical protein